jgi:hypothetical protein
MKTRIVVYSSVVLILAVGLIAYLVKSETLKVGFATTKPGALVVKSTVVKIYEGLPHPGYEPKGFAAEKQKPHLELNGEAFYQELLTIDEAGLRQIQAILSNDQSYNPFAGEKKCGGFHSDYALELQSGSGIYQLHICFGCGEVKLFGRNSEKHFDLAPDAREHLQTLITKYRKNRPDDNESIRGFRLFKSQ